MLSLGPIRDWAFLKVAVRAQGQQLLFLVYAWGTCCLAQVHGLLLCGASAWAIAVWRKCMGYCCVAQVHGLLLYGAGAWAIAVWRKCMGYCCVVQVHGLLELLYGGVSVKNTDRHQLPLCALTGIHRTRPSLCAQMHGHWGCGMELAVSKTPCKQQLPLCALTGIHCTRPSLCAQMVRAQRLDHQHGCRPAFCGHWYVLKYVAFQCIHGGQNFPYMYGSRAFM